MLKQVAHMSESRARSLEPNLNMAIISIVDTCRLAEGAFPAPPVFEGFGAVLQVAFDTWDFEEQREGFKGYHSGQILNFLKDLPENITEIVVHCSMGIDRSRAVADFIGSWYKIPVQSPDGQAKSLNDHIYGLLNHHARHILGSRL